MKWLTDRIRLESTETCGIWRTLDNLLFKDNDGVIYLAPRYMITDGYTIPNYLSWIGGKNLQWDTRCSTEHDMESRYAQAIIVKLNECQLRRLRYLKTHKDKVICENIPKKFLHIKNISFTEANNRFERMLSVSKVASPLRIKLMRFAVNFNPNWHGSKLNIDLDNIYKKDI